MLPLALVSLGLAAMSSAHPAPQASAVPSNCSNTNDTPRSLFYSGAVPGGGYIGTVSFDPATNQFEVTSNNTVTTAPSWIAFNKDLVYSVNENGNDTSVLQIAEGNTLTNVSAITGSKGVVFLEFNKDKTVLFGAGFSDGRVDIFDIDAEGNLGNHRYLQSVGTPNNNSRQTGPHVHQVLMDPSGEFFVFNDLGFDTVSVVGKKSNDSDFEILSSVTTTTRGVGPRHGAFFPVGGAQATHYLLLCEMGDIIEIFDVKYTDGVMSLSQTGRTFSTYPTEGEFARNATGDGGAGEIFISSDNAHVYTTNRLSGNPTDSVAHFSVSGMTSEVQQNGDVVATIGDISLELVDLVSSGGLLPRMFSLSKDGSMVFLGNQGETAEKNGKGLVAFKRDTASGKLEELGSLPVSLFDPAGAGNGPQFIQEV